MSEITVGELKERLAGYSDDSILYFGGLDFYRLKQRGEKLIQIEFDQTVYKDGDTGNVIVENHR